MVISIETDQNGKILIGGFFNSYNSTGSPGIMRLNPDGTMDGTFLSVFDEGTTVNSIAVSDNNDIYAGGDLYQGGSIYNHIVRLNPDGQIDQGFTVDPMPNNTVNCIKETKSHKLYIGGYFSELAAESHKYMAKLNSDGTLDPDFNAGSDFFVYPNSPAVVFDIELDGGEYVYIGGIFDRYNGMEYHSIVKLDSTGIPDENFPFNDLDFPTEIHSIVLTDQDDIFLGGKIIEKSSGLVQAVVFAGSPPEAPSALTALATGSDGGIITWSDNSIHETGFKLERKKDGANFQLTAIMDENEVSHHDQTLDANTVYFYRIKAVRSGLESGYSNEDSILTFFQAPAFEEPDSVTTSGIYLSWNKIDGAVYYNLDVSTDLFSTVPAGFENLQTEDTWMAVGSLHENAQYYFRLTARSEINHSLYSDTLHVFTRLSVPVSPSDLTVTADGSGHINISWSDNSDNEDGFVIERKTGSEDFAVIDSVATDVTIYLDAQVGNNVIYTYRVKAYRGGAGVSGTAQVTSDPSNEGMASVLGLDGIGDKLSIRIYPNPATKGIYMDTGPGENVPAGFILYNPQGQVILMENLDPGSNYVDLNSCQKGFYIIQFQRKDRTMNTRIFKQ